MRKQSIFTFLRGLFLLLAALLLASCAAPPVVVAPKKPVFPPAPDEPRFYFERSLYTSTDVEKEDKNAALKRALTGSTQTGEGLAKPYGVAVYHGRVYVSDTALHSVMVFDIPGQRFYKIGEDDEGRLAMPIGLDVDGQGNLYVSDVTTKQVQVYDPDGKHLRTIGGPKFFKRPTGIAVDSEGKRLYVVDTGTVTNEEHRVRVFDAQTGKHLLDFGKRGSDNGEFNLPRDVVIGTDGLVYVVDGGNFRVQAFKQDGTFVRVFGEVGRRGGQFSRPKEAAVDAEGNLYVVDSAFGNFQIFNTQGQLLLAVGGRGERDGMARYMLPSGIAIDGDGRVYVVDQYYRKVEVYRPARLRENEGFAVAKETQAKK
ncbi:6-bladed beta-propeller [Herbaspirillum sp. HC18]|nr:6-bladed beta-propeller [Herbaspirillum sp. HC18]